MAKLMTGIIGNEEGNPTKAVCKLQKNIWSVKQNGRIISTRVSELIM